MRAGAVTLRTRGGGGSSHPLGEPDAGREGGGLVGGHGPSLPHQGARPSARRSDAARGGVKEYLYLYRVERSKELPSETDMHVAADQGDKLCYNNAQNFIRLFKKEEGITRRVPQPAPRSQARMKVRHSAEVGRARHPRRSRPAFLLRPQKKIPPAPCIAMRDSKGTKCMNCSSCIGEWGGRSSFP
jgi:AraC-like DNA-binding protein